MLGFGGNRVGVKRKHRGVDELYNATDTIDEAETTSVLSRSCRMRGPAEETDIDIPKKMATVQSERRFGRHSMSRKNRMRAESGTCNVCSAPCSSCMHFNHVLMGSKTEEFSDETCRGTTGSQYSFNEGDVLHSFKGRPYDSLKHTVCEASDLLSVNSSHYSFSVNGETEATLRSSDISDSSDDFEMHLKFSSSRAGAEDQISPKPEIGLDQRISSNKYDDPKVCSLGPEGLEKLPSSHRLELSEIPSLKEVASSSGSPKVQSPWPHSQSDKCLVEGNSEALTKVYPNSEADTNKDSGYPCGKPLKYSVDDKQDLKSSQLVELPDMQSLHAASVDEIDEADIVEHDVKVCDICGDSGLEDLLAICCRCSDGAEHIYCMKEMFQKVPDGDWLCEECKFAEETKKQKKGVDLESKSIHKPSTSTQSSGKRHAENLDAAPAAKRLAVETCLGSPKPLSPVKAVALSRDSSFKILDKSKVRPASFGNNSSNDVVESARSPSGLLAQTAKNTLLKSSSLSTLNPKAKVKLVDEVALQRQKGTRGQPSLDIREGPNKVMSKSKSFKFSNSGFSSAGELKLRALSPRPSRVHDLKGLKQVKERNGFERKILSRLDRSLSALSVATSVSTPKVYQKLTPQGEAVSLSSAINNRESKLLKSDGKGNTLIKSNSNLARKGLEASVTPVGSAMCSSSVEQKPNLVSPTEEPSSTSLWTAEKPSINVNGIVQDGLPQSVESTDQGEKSSSCRSRPILTTGSKVALSFMESCPLGSQVSGNDVSAEMNMIKGNKLKAAIKVAMHKLPGTHGRNRVNDQLDGLGVANMDLNCEKTSQDQFSVSNKMKGLCEVPINKQTAVNHLKPFNSHAVDVVFPLKAGDSISSAPSDGKPALNTSALLKNSAIPEHEYIWLGGFEVHRRGKLPDLCGGIQAHLSSCASPKVLEMVSKLPQRIHLNEVPRVSTWPTIFHASGAKEDNIALYFFAKDYESYERNYEGLVDSLIKNDLALKGNLDGVELLIFPSNQLPENCQRWNMLFFLWGVFRVRKVSCSNSSKYSSIAGSNVVPFVRVVTTDNMSLSQNIWLPKLADEDSAACYTSHNIVLGLDGPDETRITMNGNCDNNVSSVQQTSLGSQSNSVQQGSRFDSRFSSRAGRTNALLSAKMIHDTRSLEECNLSEGGQGTDINPSLKANRTTVKGVMTETNGDASIGEDSSLLKNYPVGNEGVHDEGSVDAEKVPDIRKCGRDRIKFEGDLYEGSFDADTMPVKTKSCRDQVDLERDLNECSVFADKIPVITKSSSDQINPERDLNEGRDDADRMPVMTKSGRDQINLERELNKDRVDATKVPVITKSGRDQINLGRDLNEGCVDAEKVPDIMRSCRDQIDLERDLNADCVDTKKVPEIMRSGRDQIDLERDLNEGCVDVEEVPDVMRCGRDQIDFERKLKYDRYINIQTSLDRNLNFKWVNHQQSYHQNSQHLDLSGAATASSCGTSQKKLRNETFVDGESISKKLKAGVYECSSSRDGDSCGDGFSSRRDYLCSSSSNQFSRSKEFSDKKDIPKVVASSERYFFPVDSCLANDFQLGANSMPWKELSSNDEDRFLDRVPNLELVLGAETKQLNKGKKQPFFVGPVYKSNNHDKPSDEETDKRAEGDVSASLSLSLCFPFPDI